MKSILAILFAAAFTSKAPAPLPQKDPKATEILNTVSAVNKAKKTIEIDFSYAIKNGEVTDEQKGNLKLQGNSYRYGIFGVTKVSDGKSIATVSVADEEVVIVNTNFNDPDEFSPQEMFTIYEKGYKYRYINEIIEGGKTFHVIDLYPDTGNKQPYRKVTLTINKTTSEITRIELFHKTSAKIFSVNVLKAKYDQAFDAKIFSVECANWPGYDCDDQRGAK